MLATKYNTAKSPVTPITLLLGLGALETVAVGEADTWSATSHFPTTCPRADGKHESADALGREMVGGVCGFLGSRVMFAYRCAHQDAIHL